MDVVNDLAVLRLDDGLPADEERVWAALAARIDWLYRRPAEELYDLQADKPEPVVPRDFPDAPWPRREAERVAQALAVDPRVLLR